MKVDEKTKTLIERLQKEAIDAGNLVETEHTKLVEKLEALFEPFIDAIESYNEKISALNEAVEDLSSTVEDFIDAKSDTWLESEKGEAYSAWRDALMDAVIEEVDVPFVPDVDLPDVIGSDEAIPLSADEFM